MEQILLGIISSFLITFYCTPVIIKVAQAKKLFDNPDDERKLHKAPVPSLGGLGIFLGVFISLALSTEIWFSDASFIYYRTSLVLILFLGLKDDILGISPWKKLLGQIVVALILVFKAGLLLNNLHGFLGLNTLPITLSYLLTLFTIIVIINAFNLIDGVDGLASLVALSSAVAFGIFFLIDGQLPFALLAFTCSASLLAFLYFNFQPAKIFMGDGGAMLIGLIIAILSLQFISSAPFSKVHAIAASPVIGFGFILLPMMDTLRVFSIRMLKGRSPFSPDRNHIHHLLLDRGISHRGVSFISVLICVFFIIVSYYLSFTLGSTFGIIALIALFYLFVGILYLTEKKSY